MAAKGGHIDFMFLAPPPLTRPLDPLLSQLPFDQTMNSYPTAGDLHEDFTFISLHQNLLTIKSIQCEVSRHCAS